jgi:hypothetical protein
MSQRHEDALRVLDKWFGHDDSDASPSELSSWSVSDYKEGVIFSSPPPLRSNRLFLVLGERVVSFSPSRVTIEDAYNSLS